MWDGGRMRNEEKPYVEASGKHVTKYISDVAEVQKQPGHSTVLNWGGDLGFYSKARGNHLRFGIQQHLIDCISNGSRGVGGKRLCRENSWESKRVSQEKYCLSLASTGNRLTDKVSGSESVFGENTHQEVEGRQLWDYYWVDYCCGQLGSEENTLSPQHCLAEGGQRLGCLSIDAYLSSTECCPGSIEPLTLLSWLIPCLWRSLSTKENPQGEGDTGAGGQATELQMNSEMG